MLSRIKSCMCRRSDTPAAFGLGGERRRPLVDRDRRAGRGGPRARRVPLPTTSIESICRDAQSAALPESKAAAYQACVHDERAAYDELRKKWPRYSAKSRVTCAEPGDGAAISYVELLDLP